MLLSIEKMRDELEVYLEIDFAPFPDEHILLIYDLLRVFEHRKSAGRQAYLTALSALLRDGNKEIEQDALRRALQMQIGEQYHEEENHKQAKMSI